MSENTKTALLLLALFLLYGFAGNMDYADQLAQEQAAKSPRVRTVTAQVQQ